MTNINTGRVVTGEPHRDQGLHPWTFLVHRWPTLLALVGAAVIGNPGAASGRELLILIAVEYLLITVIGTRSATWPTLLALTAFFVALSFQDQVRTDAALAAVAAAALAIGLVRRRTDRNELLLQSVGVLLFGGLAFVAALASPLAATYLVALGWLGHGIWDFVHVWRNKAVARSYAEWCGVLDVLIATTLLLAAQQS
jgi:hypothetical protein